MLGDRRGVTSASRVFGDVGYEISDDLQRRRVEVLEKRYGGRARAHNAAALIQRAFRQRVMNRRFHQMTHPIQRIVPPIDGMARRAMTRTDRYRYAPCTSLSAQLRADRATSRHLGGDMGSRARTRSPPSPSPRHREREQSNRSMIDSLMSPRLVQRRLPAGASPSCSSPGLISHSSPQEVVASHRDVIHAQSPSASGEPPVVWIPRHPLQNSVHCNSLPRLEKKQRTPPRDLENANPVVQRPMTEQERKRQYRIALNFFNKKPERGIQLLMAWGFVDESARSVAKLLFGRRGLSRQMIGEYLGVLHSQFHSCVLEYFISQIDVRGLDIDVALRKTLHFFRLPGESQKIERIMQVFSAYYARCNPARVNAFAGGQDTVFILAYAIIMLNTDLHNRSIKASEKMKKEQFIRNLRGIDAGGNIDKLILSEMYDRIRNDEFRPGDDHVAQVTRVDTAILGKDKPRLADSHRRLVCYCRLNSIADITKKQAVSAHERDIFLFNDMIVVTKRCGISRKRSELGAVQQYNLRAHSPLQGAKVDIFSRGVFDFGILIACADGQKLFFNARNYDDRCRFVADIKESILESGEMESVRLELELDRLSMRTDSQRDSGLPEMDTPEGPTGQLRIQNGSASGNRSFRRLSFNSLDSGVVEEGYDVHS